MLIIVEPLEAAFHEDPGHPERPARVRAAMRGIDDLHLGSDLLVVRSEPAPPERLVRVHTPAHLEQLEQLCDAGAGGRAVAADDGRAGVLAGRDADADGDSALRI